VVRAIIRTVWLLSLSRGAGIPKRRAGFGGEGGRGVGGTPDRYSCCDVPHVATQWAFSDNPVWANPLAHNNNATDTFLFLIATGLILSQNIIIVV
jgi:hypothetical protein